MSAQHHYVSKFHLRGFVDPASLSLQAPWLWVGSVADGQVRRRAPKNVGTERLMFDGPGGLADRDSTIEAFLANEVEGPAAEAMREVSGWPTGSGGEIPPALSRYLAWAAARSLPMQKLERDWMMADGSSEWDTLVEPPPEGLSKDDGPKRDVAMVHPALGSRRFPHGADMASLRQDGWAVDVGDRDNFLEMVHVQAYYFQVRFFPRMRWFTLRPPVGEFFVISDRGIGWGVPEDLNAPPACLRDPSAFVLAPLTRDLILVARHDPTPWSVSCSEINAVTAAWAHDWIAGPTHESVAAALVAAGRVRGRPTT